ncbi:MATE family efflux transporter [Ruminococcus albus]|uniref:Putative efflux protein, MATE family n=1 Tax=Ruminococcus albus TaxID=1264 RepID=A0A1I1Q0N2_RUMAL|nr:MATE family efflux transporter [Ruminococcus albus]SFD15684.1 putative efflux protein, MATE family [Ruminococcus albus]
MKDLTKGNPMRLLLMFAIPMLLGSVFQQFYNLADTRIVGQYLGDKALAAVGATSSVNTVIIGFMHGLTGGFSLSAARAFGAKDNEKLKQTVAATLVLGGVTCIVLTILSLVFLDPLLHAINVKSDIYKDAKSYISLILGGMGIILSYNAQASIMRAIGDTVMPLVFLIFSAFANIFLDILFVKGLGFGIRGAAAATLITSGLSAVACFIYMKKKYPFLIPSAKHFQFSREFAREMYSSGCSMGLMNSMVGLGSLIMQGAINDLGTDTINAHIAARKISEMCMMPMMAFGGAASNFSGQNYGAGKYSRVRKGFFSATMLTWIWSVLVIIAVYIGTPFFVQAITGLHKEYIINTACQYTHFNMPFYFVLGIIFVFRHSLQSVKIKLMPTLSSFIELVGKIIVSFWLAPKIGYKAIIIAEPISWVFMAPVLIWGLVSCKQLKEPDKKEIDLNNIVLANR